MADTTTTNYALVKPEVGASDATWGAKLNTDLDTIDGQLKTNADAAAAADAKAETARQPTVLENSGSGARGISLDVASGTRFTEVLQSGGLLTVTFTSTLAAAKSSEIPRA